MKDEKVIRYQLMSEIPVDQAFDMFTVGLLNWWPPEFTWSGDVLETIAIEPRVGGRCFERGPYRFECDWGRVLVWEPPRRIMFTWQISPRREPEPDPTKASEIEVHFVPDTPYMTRIEFEHRYLSHHGEGSEAYHEAMASPEGWQYILHRYKAACEKTHMRSLE